MRIPLLAVTLTALVLGCASTPEPRPCPKAAPPNDPGPERLVRACEGTPLDLAWIQATSACPANAEDDQETVGWSALTPRLEPITEEVAPGAAYTVTLALENPTPAPLAISAGTFCFINSLEVQILDYTEARVDRVFTCGPEGGGCGNSSSRITLPGGGALKIPLPDHATTTQQGPECRFGTPAPLPEGRYSVVVDVRGKEARTELVVRAPVGEVGAAAP